MCPRVIVPAGSVLAKAGSCHGFFYYISLSSLLLSFSCVSSAGAVPLLAKLTKDTTTFRSAISAFINLAQYRCSREEGLPR